MLPARFLLLLGLLLTACAVAAGERRALLLLDEVPAVHQVAAATAASIARAGVPETQVSQFDVGDLEKATSLVAHLRRENVSVIVVALGPKAIRPALQLAGNRPIVAAFVSRATLEEGGYPADRISGVVLDQPVDRLLSLVQAALPSARQIGLLVGPATQKSSRQLERRAQDRKLTVVAEPIVSADELVGGVERLMPRSQVLLAMPDPLVHNRNTVLPLLLATYRAGVPVVGYSEAYLQAGAAIALFSTPAQIGQQVGEMVINAFEDRPVSSLQWPKYYTVEVNSAVVRSLGLTLPPPAEIQERIRAQE